MKKQLLKLLTILFCIPLLLTACKKDNILENLNIYFNENVAGAVYNQNTNAKLNLSDLTAKKPNESIMNAYTEFHFKANSAWVYKLYIKSINFYVYTNQETESSMNLVISITNLANESDLTKSETCIFDTALIPQQNKATRCEIEINKIIPNATGCDIKITLDEIVGVILNSNSEQSNFKWIIYGFELNAEHRTYSK